jgi:hypothetical protein
MAGPSDADLLVVMGHPEVFQMVVGIAYNRVEDHLPVQPLRIDRGIIAVLPDDTQ